MGISIKTVLFRTVAVIIIVIVSIVWGQRPPPRNLDEETIKRMEEELRHFKERQLQQQIENYEQFGYPPLLHPSERERLPCFNRFTSRITDSRDGKVYRTTRIGNRTWMADNLNFETDNSWCYDNDESNCQKYGRLYRRRAAVTACPAGWRLPREADLDDLIQATGIGSEFGGRKLKSRTGWNGTDDYCFSALPGGFMGRQDLFRDIGTGGYWWSEDEDSGCMAYGYSMWRTNNVGLRVCGTLVTAFSVRCVRN
jgi:uncharacterized protein (TIGR02145 family)